MALPQDLYQQNPSIRNRKQKCRCKWIHVDVLPYPRTSTWLRLHHRGGVITRLATEHRYPAIDANHRNLSPCHWNELRQSRRHAKAAAAENKFPYVSDTTIVGFFRELKRNRLRISHRGNTTLQAASVRPTQLFVQPFAAPITSAEAINGCDCSASMIVNEDE